MFRSTILIAALVVSAPTFAKPADTDVKSKVVSYADLNLASDAGQATLDGRIRAAARMVCREPGNAELQRFQRERECRTIAIADARRQVRMVTVELAVREPTKTH